MNATTLKNSILQLAVSGKLVPQCTTDEPASELLSRIRKKREELISYKKIKNTKVAPITPDEIPFEIPDTWEWVRLEELGDWKAGATPAKSKPEYHNNGTIPWLLTGDLNDGLIKEIPNKITEKALNECSVRLNPKGSVLVAMYGATIGKIGVLDFPATTNQACCACILHNEEVRDWLFTWLLYFKPYFVELGMGGAQPNISRETIVSRVFPLPPLPEQHRIVEKVEELMPLVRDFGKLEEERQELDESLPKALKASVLQQAVQGKLVSQCDADEPASELLSRIRKKREDLIATKKIKNTKIDPITEDEIPFEIPDTWEWVRLGEVVYNRGQKKPTSRFCYIDISSIDNVNNCLGSNDNVLESSNAPSRARKIVDKGDVLYSTVRPYLHNACIIDRDFPFEPIASTGFATMTCFSGLERSFLLLYLLSPTFDAYANASENSKGVAYPAINDKRFYAALIPLPPLPEQHRIVEKVQEVVGVIKDQLDFSY